MIEGFFDPLLTFLVWFEKLLLATPWWLVIAIVAGLAYLSSRSWKLSLGVVISFFMIGYFGMWDDTMRTMSIILVCTLVAIALGVTIGIAMARSDRVQSVVTPMLDIMQTMPAFVYLIPVVMLFSIGTVSGILATIVFALPPIIRLTNLGIRQVHPELVEAAVAFGATPWQVLRKVQFPLAMPSVMAGLNQTIMMALSMVVIAALIGAGGLGNPVVQGFNTLEIGLATIGGLSIVLLAMILDRITQGIAQK